MKKIRTLLALLLASVVLASAPAAAELNNPNLGYFDIVMTKVSNKEVIFTFRMSTVPTDDLEPRPDGLKGKGNYMFWIRGDYTTAIFAFQHEDQPNHGLVDVVRFAIQQFSDVPGFQINDRNGKTPAIARRPYPYEPKPTNALIDFTRPDPVISLYHHRAGFVSQSGCRNCQLLAQLRWSTVDRTKNAKVRFYYQGADSGAFIVYHDDYGPIAKIIVSGVLQLQPPYLAYFFEVQ